MAKIVRYNGNLVPFASSSLGSERTIFGQVTQANDITSQFTPEFLRGWGIVGPSDQPTLQDFNAVSYTHGQILSYLHQMGIAEFDSSQEYHNGSVSQTGGVVYISQQNNNTGNAPASSPASWIKLTAGQLINVQIFTATGVYTPTPGTSSIIVECQGAGGGGGGAPATIAGQTSLGAGGSAGAYSKGRFTSAFSGLTATVGTGGVGGTGAAGSAGGASSLGALITAPGGSGGATAGPSNAQFFVGSSSVLAGTGGNIESQQGAAANYGTSLNVTTIQIGISGRSHFSPGIGSNVGAGGTNAVGPGSGGGGTGLLASAAAVKGGNGANGKIIIWEFA